VVFTDLAGSTELMARLGDEAFDRVRAEHFDRLAAVVAGFEGSLIKNTGDGILATFASAVAALDAAVAAQQATDSHSRQDGVALRLRVGLAVGEVAFDAGDVFGTPVVEAARLVATAEPGTILCTGLVRAIAGSRAGRTFTDLGAIELRGLPDPVPACEVNWAPAVTAPSIGLPSVLTGAGRIFVGRTDPLDRLQQRWKEAAAGERRLVLIGGEPGVGKTRLATALGQRLHDEGALVLAGRCDEDLGVPYQPVVEALRHYATSSPSPRLGRHGGELARLVPELPELVSGLPDPLRSDPETEQYRLFDAVAAWLGDVSNETPVLLVVDDLHWAAKPTLLLLRHVLRTSEPLRLLVVATYRDSDVGRGHPLADLLADVPRLEGAERLLLSGLDVPEVSAFIAEAAGHELDEDGEELARMVWRETEGNAFFVAEVLRHLAESGAIEQRDGRWVVAQRLEDLGVPQGVRDVVGRRLSRLSDGANHVLACASVVGLEFEPAIVQLTSGLTEDAVLAGLDEAIGARLVVEAPGPVPRNRFTHALVRGTLYDELSAARRVALHRRVAEAIEALHGHDLDDHLPALAHHWARASAPAAETGRAVEYARRAGDRALAQFANDEAATYYREALELLNTVGAAADDPRRLPLLISLGEAETRAGDAGHRETLLSAAALAGRLGDADAMARAALANSRGFLPSLVGAVDADRVAALERALAATPPADSAIRARLLSTLSLELTYSQLDKQRRLSLSDEAVAMARRLSDAETLAHVLITRSSAALHAESLDLRLADATELAHLAPSLVDPATRARALVMAYRIIILSGRVEEADPLLDEAGVLAGELGQPSVRWITGFLRAGRLILAGCLDEAEVAAVKANEIGWATRQLDARWALAWQLFAIRSQRARVDDEVIRLLDSSEAEYRMANAQLDFLDLSSAIARVELGRPDEARAAFERVVSRSRSLDYYSIINDVLLAELAVRLDEHTHAEALYQRLLPDARWVVPHAGLVVPGVSFHLGLLAAFLGRFADAGVHFAQAAAEQERIGARSFLARTRLEWARMLLSRAETGDVDRARSLLAQALAVAGELGLRAIERQAATLLEGGPPA
jgi:hypothetical protein